MCLFRGGVKARGRHEHGRRHTRKALEAVPMEHRPDSDSSSEGAWARVFGVHVCLVCRCTVNSSSDKAMHEQGAAHRAKCCSSPSLAASPLVANSATSHASITGDPADGALGDLALAIVSDRVNVLTSSNSSQASSCMSDVDFLTSLMELNGHNFLSVCSGDGFQQ